MRATVTNSTKLEESFRKLTMFTGKDHFEYSHFCIIKVSNCFMILIQVNIKHNVLHSNFTLGIQ